MSENKPTREQILSEPAGARLDGWVAEFVMDEPGEALLVASDDGGKSSALSETSQTQRGVYWYTSRQAVEKFCQEHPQYKPVVWVRHERYSRDIAAAWPVFEKLGPAWVISQSDSGGWPDDCRWFCFLPVEYGGKADGEVMAPTAPLAICKAALLAVLEVER
jgi:hypothetical protein